MKNNIFAITGYSGAGKTATIKGLLSNESLNIRLSVSCTTRPMREGEKNHREYHFISKEKFMSRKKKDEFIEITEYNGFLYGTLKSEVSAILHNRNDVIVEVDIFGIEAIKKTFPQAVTIFINASNREILKRLKQRGTETEEVVKGRLLKNEELKSIQYPFDFIFHNKTLKRTIAKIKNIILKITESRTQINYSMKSIVGNFRSENQDRVQVTQNDLGEVLCVVCDGMGGHIGGNFAAEVAINSLSDEFKQQSFQNLNSKDISEWLTGVVKQINSNLKTQSKMKRELYDMGTTLSAAIILDSIVYILHVGDTRVYWINEGYIQQITADHNVKNVLIEEKKIPKFDILKSRIGNALTSALGPNKQTKIDVFSMPLKNGKMLLTTDGVHDSISNDEMLSILNAKDSKLEDQVSDLIVVAERNGSKDNLTALLVGIQNA